MTRASAFLAPLFPALVGAAGLLCACSKGSDYSAPAGAASKALPPGVHIGLAIEAPKDTHYEMLCAVRAYHSGPGQLANRYGVDQTGPFKDVIPSPNAHCTAKIDSGAAPVRVTLTKPGTTQSMTLDTVGDAGKKTLHVW